MFASFLGRVAGIVAGRSLVRIHTCSRSRRWSRSSVLPLLWVWLTCATSPTTTSASWKSSGRRAARCREGQIIALGGEAGYQAALLRGGVHLGLWRWQYAVHKVRLVTISEGKIGYVYARDGEPLPSSQTLGRVVDCNNFQDAAAFLSGDVPGQRGRQRAVLREGVYAINLARVHGDHRDRRSTRSKTLSIAQSWRRSTSGAMRCWRSMASARSSIGRKMHAADPLEIDGHHEVDSIGIVTVHDGPSLLPGEIIAPAVGTDAERSALPQQLPGRRGVSRGRWSARPAVRAAHRRHVLHQPLVRLGRADSQDGRAHRLRRRRRELLRPRGPGRHRHRLPPRRARRRRRARRAPAAARPRQVRVQHVGRQHRARADDELRAALDHRQDASRIGTTRA